MEKINTASELKSAIEKLEHRRSCELVLLKEQFYVTYEDLKPLNLIKNKLKEMILAPNLKTEVIDATIGFVSGLATKKILVGNSSNYLKKVLGLIVEMAVANKVTKNADEIKAIGSILLHKIINQPTDPEKS